MDAKKRVYVGLGTNMGRRALLMDEAVRRLDSGVGRVLATSFLYETEPELVTDQPRFLNAAVLVETPIGDPHRLLDALQAIEAEMGRPSLGERVRYGPRPIDLDILCYGDGTVVRSARLSVPHVLLRDRAFAIRPLVDLDPTLVVPPVSGSAQSQPASVSALWTRVCAMHPDGARPQRVMPVGPDRVVDLDDVDARASPLVMAIVNATPDSFSGDGLASAPAAAYIDKVLVEGADIVDVGGYSTRPGHADVSVQEEIERVAPLVKTLASLRSAAADTTATGTDTPPAGSAPAIVMSIDTFRPEVARACLDAARGSDRVAVAWINDVMGMRCDPHAMVGLLREHDGVGVVITHSRGALDSMVRDGGASADLLAPLDAFNAEDGIVSRVAADLLTTAAWAESRGVARWRIVLDPGVGFGKSPSENAALAGGTRRLRALVGGYPILVAASRKSFMGHIVREAAEGRRKKHESDGPIDAAFVREHASHVVTAVAAWEGAHIVRVHDVPSSRGILDLTAALARGRAPR